MVQHIESTKLKPLKSVLWKNNSHNKDIRKGGEAVPILLLQKCWGTKYTQSYEMHLHLLWKYGLLHWTVSQLILSRYSLAQNTHYISKKGPVPLVESGEK